MEAKKLDEQNAVPEDRGWPLHLWLDTEPVADFVPSGLPGQSQVVVSVPIGWYLVSTEHGIRLKHTLRVKGEVGPTRIYGMASRGEEGFRIRT